MGVITYRSSPFASPIIYVKKSNDTGRLCFYTQQINYLIFSTGDTSPPLDDLNSRFHERNIFLVQIFQSGIGKFHFIHLFESMYHLLLMVIPINLLY